jgi:hypothetical protein
MFILLSEAKRMVGAEGALSVSQRKRRSEIEKIGYPLGFFRYPGANYKPVAR